MGKIEWGNEILRHVGAAAAGAALDQAAILSQVAGSFVGADINAFDPPGTTYQVIPALGTGLVPAFVVFPYIVVSRTGVLTGAPAFKAGTNGAHDNLTTSLTVTTVANLNAAAAGYRNSFALALLASVFIPSPDLGSPLIIEMVTAATGAGAALVLRPIYVGPIIQFP